MPPAPLSILSPRIVALALVAAGPPPATACPTPIALAVPWTAPAAAPTAVTAPPVARAAPRRDADAARRNVAARIGDMLEEHYVFPDVAEACAERLDRLAAEGALDAAADPAALASILTTELQAVSSDKHLRVTPAPPRRDPDASGRERSPWEQGRVHNFGFEQVMRLPGNVGLLDLRSFQSVDVGRDTAVAAMGFLANSDAIIVDLRRNGGGSPEMVQLLCSYFFDEPTHLNSLYWRAEDRTDEFWTLDELPGRRMSDVPLFILTSRDTFSGAEEFAYNMQTRERATVVGETTGGGAHPGDLFDVDGTLAIFIPTGRAINPVTGTNWEGTGVMPDVPVDAAKALDEALGRARRAAEEHRAKLSG